MKKFIALSAIALTSGFVVALANSNAEDEVKKETQYESSSTGSTDSAGQSAGAAGDMSKTGPDSSNPSKSGEKTAKTEKTCVDASGATLHKSDQGFERCITEKHASEKGMSGEVPHDSSEAQPGLGGSGTGTPGSSN